MWVQDFDGPPGAGPDPELWTHEIGGGGWGDQQRQVYTDAVANAALDGAGRLRITARREPDGTITSARLVTKGCFATLHGRVEARIKVSTSQGLWPAFWLLGADFFDKRTPWPNCGEIDVMEHVGREPNRVYSTLHAPAYNGAGGYGQPLDLSAPAGSAFHTFAVEWDSGHMTFSVDGTRFFTADKAQIESTRGPWVYDHPFFIILNNAVGGDWPGPPNASTQFPQNLTIDYVRVYR